MSKWTLPDVSQLETHCTCGRSHGAFRLVLQAPIDIVSRQGLGQADVIVGSGGEYLSEKVTRCQGKKSTKFVRVAGRRRSRTFTFKWRSTLMCLMCPFTPGQSNAVFLHILHSALPCVALGLLLIWMCWQHNTMGLNSDFHNFCQCSTPQCMVVYFHELWYTTM